MTPPAPDADTDGGPLLFHASTVAIGGRAVMIEGRSGAGKSDLALRLIDRGATLVSDDRTIVTRLDDALIATAPPTIAGKMEVRGIGIVAMPHVDAVPVAMLVRLASPERLPEPAQRDMLGVPVREFVVDGLEGSAPLKVEIALRMLAATA